MKNPNKRINSNIVGHPTRVVSLRSGGLRGKETREETRTRALPVSGDGTTPPPPSRRDILVATATTALSAVIFTMGNPAAAEEGEATGASSDASAATPPSTRSGSSSPQSLLYVVSPTAIGGAETFSTINAAVAAAAAAAAAAASASAPVVPITIRVSPGKYLERVVVPASLAGSLTIEAAPGAAAAEVVVEHRTSAPYEATFEAASGWGSARWNQVDP
jgi:pectin methylesterase-like acyl-CoA thioesterase